MKLEIIEKALYYYYSGMVHLEKETKERIDFEVDGEDIYMVYGMGYLYFQCTCKNCSFKGSAKLNPLCARKWACQLYLSHQYVRKQQDKKRRGE